MALHIALMNIAAPLVAILVAHIGYPGTDRSMALWSASAIQIALLWMWHVPLLHRWATESGTQQVLMHGSLFVAAAGFWTLLACMPARSSWQGIFLLLLTGKLSCLLGALLIFAPRLLYAGHHHSASLDDQHLAGLLMITACPLSYVTAGVVLAAQIMTDLGRTTGAADGRKAALAG
jgi:putative membrane protein